MMDREWNAILKRYGQSVTVYPDEQAQGLRRKAFLQPVLDRGEGQQIPSPLGLRREDRFLYLGPADLPLAAGVSRVEWKQQVYEVQSAHSVGGDSVNHWWAVLRPADQEAL